MSVNGIPRDKETIKILLSLVNTVDSDLTN